VVTREAVDGALRAFGTRSDAFVLDVVQDSDVDGAQLLPGPRRVRFHREELSVDLLVHDSGGTGGLQLLVRAAPHGHFVIRAAIRGRELGIEVAAAGRTDASGVARLIGIPHGLTSLQLEGVPRRPRVRTAWVRF
jgi:hypothetical protein